MDPGAENSVKSVRKSKEEKKLLRKQIKSSHVLLKHEGISAASQTTRSLVVSNGGLGNGVSREELSAALRAVGELEALIMPPYKPYAFVTYRSEESARKAHVQLNGERLPCAESSVTLYLSYVDSVPCEEERPLPFPEGLVLVEEFVSLDEEALLLAAIDWSSADDVTAQKALKHRRVKHYGFEFRYDNNNVDKDKPLPVGIPQECLPVLQRCVTDKLIPFMPDQLTVNQYESGQGIPPHVDTHSAFEDAIMSLSLGAQTVMEFRHPDGRLVPVVLPGRSLLVMRGESRFLWTHGITPRKFDVVPARDPQCPAHEKPDLQAHSSLTLKKRSTRTSFTFRRIRHEPCRCAFPSACDSQGPSALSASSPPLPSLPSSHAAAAHLEEEYVHRVYDAIASHFSSTRHSPWPRVCHFLSSLPAGSVLADVGCGNGKYLGVNPEVVAVGCDRSGALIQICAERGFQAFVSDALDVPLRTASCDACISIAVIHHFSTQERRLAAVKELLRLLRPGGQALIYVWAFEQEFNKQRSKYLKDRDKEPPGSQNATENGSEHSQEPPCTSTVSTSRHLEDQHRTGDDCGDFSKSTDSKLSVHTNRTAFNSQDLLVPWHLKGGQKREEEESAEGVTKDKRSENSKKFSENSSSACGLSSVNGSEHYPDSGPASDTSRTTHSSDSSSSIFHRYYHVFQQGELEQLCSQVAEVRVQSSYHDQGNWCVLLEKETN